MLLRRPRLTFGLLILLIATLSSCQTIAYYTQAARGQAQIIFTKKPIPEILANPSSPPQLKSQLRLARELVAFAETELGLPSSGSYAHYADLKRPHLSYIVYAAPELSLEPKTWTYPIIGKQDYRGFFKRKDAEKLIAKLQSQGYETYLGATNAYSTLGWFDDPILNTFVNYPEADLAELIFHELTHHRYYKSGNTDLNEALAEVVAREGTRRWLKSKNKHTALANYELRLKRRSLIRSQITSTTEALAELYQSDLPTPQKRNRKSLLINQLRTNISTLYQGWQQRSPNFLSSPTTNARLIAFTTYEAHIPTLEKILTDSNHNLETLFNNLPEVSNPVPNQ
ncbi:MAG: aminopeptidase [Verrucomicrobiota bacterium]